MSGHPKRLRRSAPSSDLLGDDEPVFFMPAPESSQGPKKRKQTVELPDGPVCFEDLFEWRNDVVRRVIQHWRLRNLSTSEKKIRLHLTTAYSGVGFGEAAAAMVADAFNKLSLF